MAKEIVNKSKLLQLEKLLQKASIKNTKEYLAKEINVSVRTINTYLNFLRDEYNIEIRIEKVGKKHCYQYANKLESIENIIVDVKDIPELQEVVSVLNKIAVFKNISCLESLKNRINNSLKYHQEDTIEFEPIIYFDEPTIVASKNLEIIGRLYQTVRDKQVIDVTYRAFGKLPKIYTLSPYFLKEYKHMWYLYGYNHATKKNVAIPCLAVDRIVDVVINKEKKYVEPTQKFQHLFDFNLGITINENLIPIILDIEIDEALKNYLTAYPLNASQIIKENHLKVKIVPNYELEQWVLSYGDQIKVIGPESFKEKIKERILKQFKQYE